MYVGIDVGGTKTLVAVLDDGGVITEQVRFPTPHNYDDFLIELATTIEHFTVQDFSAGGIGIPVTEFDRLNERAISFGNLPWRNVLVQKDVENICKCPIAVENDAKLAGLSEAKLLQNAFAKILYVTVSTGIGFSLIDQGIIDVNFADGGGHNMLVEYRGKLVPWESFASGHAIVERFGKKAADITDHDTWSIIARNLAVGLIDLVAFTEPEVIVIGGSIGTYFERYGKLLENELKKYKLPLLKIPHIMGAQRPEEAVVYGCYDIAKQVYPHAKNIN